MNCAFCGRHTELGLLLKKFVSDENGVKQLDMQLVRDEGPLVPVVCVPASDECLRKFMEFCQGTEEATHEDALVN